MASIVGSGSHTRQPLRRLCAVALLAPAALIPLVTAGGSAAASRHSTPRAASAHSASALLNLAFADARAKGSFHQALSQDVGGIQGSLDDDVSLTSGRQAITSASGTRAEVEVIGQTAYVSGNQYALRSYFKFTSNQVAVVASNWVSIPSTNSAFASIAYDVTVPTALTEVAPSGHLTEGSPTTVDGQKVIPVSGGAPGAFNGGTGGKTTLYITASSDPLPVRVTVNVTQSNNKKLALTGTMSDWGEHVDVMPPTKQLLSASQVNLLVSELAGFAIPGEPGYFSVDGEHGHAVPFARPWGVACKPIRIAVQPSVPTWAYTQVAAVVAEARKDGIDVTIESPQLKWSHSSLYYRSGQSAATSAQVNVFATSSMATNKDKLPLQLASSSKLENDKQHEDLTSVSAVFSLPLITGHPQEVRRSIRQLIAWTQGISETTDPVSGITDRSFTDGFTHSDIAAMLAMSGCTSSSTSGTVTGIAA